MYKLLSFVILIVCLLFSSSKALAKDTQECTGTIEKSNSFSKEVADRDLCPDDTVCTIGGIKPFPHKCFGPKLNAAGVPNTVKCKKISSCNDGDSYSNRTCTPAGGGASYPAYDIIDKDNICPVKHTAVNSTDIATCLCKLNADAGTPAATPCTDPAKCTTGQGTRCNLRDGSPIPPLVPGAKAVAIPNSGILTAIGCVPTQPQALVEGLIRYGTLAAGGVAFLLMILGAIQMITAEGNPETIKHAQERFYSAIIGLLLIIFSVLLMQVIGVDILDLPGFSR